MPSPEKLLEMQAISEQLEKAKSDFKEAMDKFTSKASVLNYMLLEEIDYADYIYGRKAPPEWMRQLPSKEWIFEGREQNKRIEERERRKKPGKKKKIADKMYIKLMGGFK